jgi:hypothetical protein
LCLGAQELDNITKSHELYKDRYFVMYQHESPLPCPSALLEPLQSILQVSVVIEDSDDESLSKLEADTQVPRKRTRHGETRKGKSIKAVNALLKQTLYFESQQKFGDFIGVGKGTVSACFCNKKRKVIRGWTLSRVLM